MSNYYNEERYFTRDIPPEWYPKPIKEKKEMNKYLITFSYKDGVLRDRITPNMYCMESQRLPYSSKEEALAKAKELALLQTDKKFYVTQLLTVTESVPPTPPEPTVTYQII